MDTRVVRRERLAERFREVRDLFAGK